MNDNDATILDIQLRHRTIHLAPLTASDFRNASWRFISQSLKTRFPQLQLPRYQKYHWQHCTGYTWIQMVCDEFVPTRFLNFLNFISVPDDIFQDIHYKKTLRPRQFFFLRKRTLISTPQSVQKIFTLHTIHLHNRLSNIELNSNTNNELRQIYPRHGKTASHNNIFPQNISPAERANVLANHFAKATHSTLDMLWSWNECINWFPLNLTGDSSVQKAELEQKVDRANAILP